MSARPFVFSERLATRLGFAAPWLLLVFGITLTLTAWQAARVEERSRWEAAFTLTADKLAAGIEARMKAHEYLLRGVAGLFAASNGVDRQEFRRYISNLHLEAGYPGIQGIGFAAAIAPENLGRHIQDIRREGFADYVVRPVGARSQYSAIVYLEPFDWRNQRAFGYDMLSEPIRRAAMERAGRTGLAALSGKVTLIQETERDVQPGTLLYVPVYKPPGGDTRDGAGQLLGWAYSPLRMRDMIDGLLNTEFPELQAQLGIGLYDGSETDSEQLLFHSPTLPGSAALLQHRNQLTIAGREWTLKSYALPGFVEQVQRQHSTWILNGGLLVTLLLSAAAALVARSHRQISRTLGQLSASTDALRESREELQTIYDASDAAMFMVDTSGNIVHANQRMGELFGCPTAELLGSPYLAHVHPDDIQAAERNILGLAAGDLPTVATDRRYVRCSGEAFWGFVSSRPLTDADGHAHHVVGVIVDTSERHLAEARLRQSEQRYRTLTETMLDVAWTADVDSMAFTYCSPAIVELRGYSPEEMIGAPLTLGMAPEDVVRITRSVLERAAAFKTGNARHYTDELLQRRKDGSTVWTEIVSHYYRDPDSGRLCLRGVTRDIDERKQIEDELRIAAVAFESHESMVVTDRRGRIVRVNHAFEELNGYPAAEVIGKSLRFVHSGRHDHDFYAQMWDLIQAQGYWQGEIWNRRKDGELSPQWLTITAVKNAQGEPTHYIGTSLDISQRLARENEIRNLAFYDPLTGLANRRLLLDRLTHAFAKSSRSGKLGALIYLDLDRFKELNDRLGHAEGDRLLTIVADRLNLNVREGDTVARLGGDEFVVLVEDLDGLPGEAAVQARSVAEKLHAALNAPYTLQGSMPDDWRCTPSIGVALFADHRETSESLLRRADQALYAAKHAGRNTIRFAEEDIPPETAPATSTADV